MDVVPSTKRYLSPDAAPVVGRDCCHLSSKSGRTMEPRADSKNDDEDDMYANDDDEYGNEDEEGDEDESSYSGLTPIIHTREFVLMWMKDGHMLYTGDIRVTHDNRVSKLADNTLEIKNLKPQDAGSYVCMLGTIQKENVTHTLNVLMTPRIGKVTPGPSKTILKGQPLTLECNATGYPAPAISWSRKGKNLPDGEEMIQGSSITFDSVSRKHAGVYECMASNNIGEPATATVAVTVEYSPEIEIEKEIVNSGEGYDAELVCEVHSEPKAKVGWSKDGKPMHGTPRATMTHQGSRHILQIQNTQKSDFGSYTCQANNSLGRLHKVIRLSGEPSPPKFASEEPLERGQALEWRSSEWKAVHPMVENPEGNVYTVRHELTDLSTGQYEVILLAQNTYGWSDPSIAHIFELTKNQDQRILAGAIGNAGMPLSLSRPWVKQVWLLQLNPHSLRCLPSSASALFSCSQLRGYKKDCVLPSGGKLRLVT
ncbi:hypothetical protein B566_EDAN018038 [Ephemera danica]|nr:hypothetical protein B566_EDAN018038 [Ephemera danica]